MTHRADHEEIGGASAADYAGDHDQGHGRNGVDEALLLIDKYPTHYLPEVGRQVMGRGGGIDYHVPTRLPIPGEDTEAMFRRLVAFSFAVGRQYRADGGRASIEEAIRTAQDVGDRRGMSHPVGMSSEVEFAPVSVSEPLTGKKFELGRLPAPTARFAEPAVQAVADIGPYFTPAAPLFAARDIAAGLKHGDPTEVATAAFGAPGKYAKAALVGASALMPSEAEASPASAARMAIMHAMQPWNAVKSKGLGVLVSPSLGIGKPAQNPLDEFGDVLLVGKKHLAEPSKANPIFSQDVWTPRFPKTENYNHKDFKGEGFFSPFHGKDVPVTVENVLRDMTRRPLVGGEYRINSFDEPEPNFGYLVGSSAKMFKTPEEVIAARDRLMPKTSANREYNNAQLTHANLAYELSDRRPSFGEFENLSDEDYLTSALINNNLKAYYMKLDPELQARVDAHKENLQNLPSAYFEAKPQRAVKFDEFAGAVMPSGEGFDYAADALKELGISNIIRHPQYITKPGEFVLEHFPEHTFAEGGEVERENFGDGGIIGKALQAIRAYHGSPHKFDKFDIGKIGTGEGAQAFGHGLYFAGNEDVAKSYRDILSNRDTFSTGYSSPHYNAKKLVERFNNDPEYAIDAIQHAIDSGAGDPRLNEQTLELLRSGKYAEPLQNSGHMYEVDLNVHPDRMLQFDRTIAEQHPNIERRLNTLFPISGSQSGESVLRDLERSDATKKLADRGNISIPAAVSDRLLDAGIPGVRYLDEGSRHAGEGTSNYVMFTDKPIKILRRYENGGEVEREHFDKGGLAAALKAAARAAEEASKRIPIERAREMVASPFSENPESVQKALDYANSLRVSQGQERVPGSFYNVKQTRPVSEVTSTVEDLPGVKTKEVNPMSWEDIVRQYKGATMFNVAGDRSNLGRMTRINDRELAWPVDLHAGPKYMLEPNEEMVWANNPAHATGFQKAIAEAAKRGPVIGAYHPMGVQSVDSSHNMIDALLAQIGRGDVGLDEMRAADDMLRRGAQADKDKVQLAIDAMQKWPGFENAREASEFARNLEGTRRSEIVKFLDKAPFLKAGFPAVGETRVAITDPALRDVSGNMLGHRIVEFDPNTLAPKKELAFTHSTYTSPTAGRYVGDVPLVQTQYAMPEVERDIMTKLAKGDRVVHPYSTDPLGRSSWRKSFETRKLGQEVNQEMLDSIMMGLERQSKYGLAEGGSVIDGALDVISNLPQNAEAETSA